MRFLPYIAKHLRRGWLRTLSTVLAMSVCIFLFTVLETAIATINSGLESASDKRLVVRNAVSLIFTLPVFYKERIATVPGVRRVAKASWFGGVYKDFRNFFPNFAVDHEAYFAMHPEYEIPPDQYQAFVADLRGAIVGRDTMERFGWKIGDTIQMESTIPYHRTGRPFEFVIRGVYDADLSRNPGTNLTQFFFHFRYLWESTGRRPGAGSFSVEIDDPQQAAVVGSAIDALFANSDNQTKSETEAAFRASFISLAGPIVLLLRTIGLAVTFTILIVTANTMSMAVRERRKEIAVLKTLGFSSRRVLALVLAEAAMLGAAGGTLGVLLGRATLVLITKVPGVPDVLRSAGLAGLSPALAASALGLAVGIGLLAGLVPALLAFRARVTETLRTL